MRRILFLTLLFFIAYINYSFAKTANATPDEYIVTINKVELYNSTTSTWVTVASGDLTFDIASVNAGEVAGSYVSGAAIPEGVYTQERTTVSRTFYIKASGTIDATTYYTDTGNTSFETDGLAANTNTTGPAVRGKVVVPTTGLQGAGFTVQGDYFYHEGDLPSPITVKKSLTKKMRIKFNVLNTAEFNDLGTPGSAICYNQPPTVTFEVVD